MSRVDTFTRAIIKLRGRVLLVEIARSRQERALGLMGRHELAPGMGMLFVMPGGPANFHMKNTSVPLDIVFFDKSRRVIDVAHMEPHVGKSSCPFDVRYALELSAGACEELGVRKGDRFEVMIDKASILRSLIEESLVS